MPKPLAQSRCSDRSSKLRRPRRVVDGRWLVCVACLSVPAAAQGSGDADTPAPRTTPREIIDRLIAEPPAGGGRAVTPLRTDFDDPAEADGPAGLDPDVVHVDPDAPLPRLRREGGFVVERPGRLIAVPDPSAADGAELWVFAFDRVAGVDDLRPMIVQKTRRLQMMQDVREAPPAGGDDATPASSGRGRLVGQFLVSGQVHTHRGVNYLLPSTVRARPDAGSAGLRDAAAEERPAATPRSANDEPRRGTVLANDAFESSVGSTPATFAGGDDPIQQMEALLTRPGGAGATPGDPSVGPVAEGVNPDPDADTPVIAAPRQEGSYLVERRGRLVGGRSGGPVLFSFSADGAATDDPPVVLMPCGLLEDLEDQVRGVDVAPEFAVSGRVYAYRGVNHLLPTSYRTVPRRDNLGD